MNCWWDTHWSTSWSWAVIITNGHNLWNLCNFSVGFMFVCQWATSKTTRMRHSCLQCCCTSNESDMKVYYVSCLAVAIFSAYFKWGPVNSVRSGMWPLHLGWNRVNQPRLYCPFVGTSESSRFHQFRTDANEKFYRMTEAFAEKYESHMYRHYIKHPLRLYISFSHNAHKWTYRNKYIYI